MVKKDAAKTELTINAISPVCSANIFAKASSVEVFVSSCELINKSSINCAIFSELSEFSSWTTKFRPFQSQILSPHQNIPNLYKLHFQFHHQSL